MDEEMMGVVEQPMNVPVEPLPPLEQPKKAKSLRLLGGVALILVALALLLALFGNKGDKQQSSSTTEQAENKVSDNVYQNKEYFYAVTLPPKWRAQPTSADTQTMSFTTSGDALLTIKATRQQGSLDAYLATLTGIKVNKTAPIKVGGYDGVEQSESWTAQGIQVTSAYVKIQDMIYSLTLLPSEGKNVVTNESVIREYKNVLISFRLTDTSQLGQDWVEYQWGEWSISHPQNWTVKKGEPIEDGSTLMIFRDDYEIVITSSTILSPAVCLFRDSPAVTGYSGDLRNKEYVEISNEWSGYVMRRYFKGLVEGKAELSFCGKSVDQEQFISPMSFGSMAYSVPAQYDQDILAEMDKIVATIQPINYGD